MNAQGTQDDDGMPAEVDFARGVRGKLYKPDLHLIPPARLEPQVQDTLLNWATADFTRPTIPSASTNLGDIPRRHDDPVPIRQNGRPIGV